MHTIWALPLAVALSFPVLAMSVAEPGDQCLILISQVESRLDTSPPQDEESAKRARELLREAKEAQQDGDFKSCMSKIRKAFKAFNKS